MSAVHLEMLGAGVASQVYSVKNGCSDTTKQRSKICIKVACGGVNSKDNFWNYAYWLKFVNTEKHYCLPKIYFLDTDNKLAVMHQYEITVHDAIESLKSGDEKDKRTKLARLWLKKYFGDVVGNRRLEAIREFLRNAFDVTSTSAGYDKYMQMLARDKVYPTQELRSFYEYFLRVLIPAGNQFRFPMEDVHMSNVMLNKFGEMVIIDPSF